MNKYINRILIIVAYIVGLFLILLGVISLFDGSGKIYAIFNILFALGFLPFIFSLIKARFSQFPSDKFKIFYIIVFILGYSISFGFLTGKENLITESPKQIIIEDFDNEIKKEVKNKIIFDIEGLFGKNIDEIKTILGKPSNDTEPRDLQTNITSEDQLAKEWDKTWSRDEYELSAFYNVKTREIIDFFISSNDPSGATVNTDILEEIVGGISLVNFKIEKVPARNKPGHFTGIKIIPNK